MKALSKKILYYFCVSIFFITLCCSVISCKRQNQSVANGVWWWDSELNVDEHLDFAMSQGVNQIYYCDTSFEQNTIDFLQKCEKNYVEVFMLDGNYKWLTDDEKKRILYQKLDAYVQFNSQSQFKFAGVHLDIEPHQSESFDGERETLIYKLIRLIYELKEKYPTIYFEYDIPFWLHDQIEFGGQVKPAYAHIIDIANKVTVMSYRDDALAILDVASEEIEYAKSVDKALNLSVETDDVGDDIVSFYEDGKTHLNKQLKILKERLPSDFGIAVHHVESWKKLK